MSGYAKWTRAWSDPLLAELYDELDRVSKSLTGGSTEQGCLREAMVQVFVADQHIEAREREMQIGGDA
jgi:hypothetical protein